MKNLFNAQLIPNSGRKSNKKKTELSFCMRRVFLTIISLSGVIGTLYCQDYIYKSDGSEIKAKVIEITIETIKYKLFEQQDGPIRNIAINDVFMVIYQDGTKEVLKSPSTPQKTENQNTEKSIQKNIATNYSQESKDDGQGVVFNFGMRAGYFIPSEDAISEIYGGGVCFGSDIYVRSKTGFGGGMSFEYFKKRGDPYKYSSGLDIQDASAKISLIPIYLTGGYHLVNNNKIIPYCGVGFGFCLVNEKVEMTVIDPDTGDPLYQSAQISENAFCFHVLTGIQLKLLYFELKYSNGAIDGSGGAGGNKVNVGGLTISGGLKF